MDLHFGAPITDISIVNSLRVDGTIQRGRSAKMHFFSRVFPSYPSRRRLLFFSSAAGKSRSKAFGVARTLSAVADASKASNVTFSVPTLGVLSQFPIIVIIFLYH